VVLAQAAVARDIAPCAVAEAGLTHHTVEVEGAVLEAAALGDVVDVGVGGQAVDGGRREEVVAQQRVGRAPDPEPK